MTAEFGARLDAQFAVDPGQVRLDGLRADEQRGRDVAVLHARRCEVGDPLLGRRELSAAALSDVRTGEFGLGAVGPQRHVQSLEDVRGFLKACRCSLPPALPPPQLAEKQQRSSTLERHRQPVELGDRTFDGRGRGIEVTLVGQQHASATGADGQHPRAVQPLSVALERADEGLGLGASAHFNQGLDGVRQEHGIGKFGRCRCRIEPVQQRLQRRDRGLATTQRDFQESERANDPVRQPE